MARTVPAASAPDHEQLGSASKPLGGLLEFWLYAFLARPLSSSSTQRARIHSFSRATTHPADQAATEKTTQPYSLSLHHQTDRQRRKPASSRLRMVRSDSDGRGGTNMYIRTVTRPPTLPHCPAARPGYWAVEKEVNRVLAKSWRPRKQYTTMYCVHTKKRRNAGFRREVDSGS